MRIIDLQVENIKRIKALNISLPRNLVVIGGKNAAGKSSVLDSIWDAFTGGKKFEKMIREGQDKGSITVNIGKFIITKKYHHKGSEEVASLEVKNAEGYREPSPQTLLNSFYGENTFDALEFSRLKKEDQVSQLKELLGLDFSELDKRRQEAYTERTILNREASKLETNLAQNEKTPGIPESEIVVSDLLNELTSIQKRNQEKEKASEELKRISERGTVSKERISELNKQLESIQAQIILLNQHIENTRNQYILQKEVVSQMVHEDESIIKDRISKAEVINSQIRKNKFFEECKSQFFAVSSKAIELTREIAKIDQKKIEMTKNAKFPVDGIEFGETGLLLNGIPFQNASSAEKLKISVAMGIALNPELKVMQIRDGSLLDNESLEIVNKMAIEADMQIIMEKVSEGSECSIIIEDGYIQGDERFL